MADSPTYLSQVLPPSDSPTYLSQVLPPSDSSTEYSNIYLCIKVQRIEVSGEFFHHKVCVQEQFLLNGKIILVHCKQKSVYYWTQFDTV